MGYVGHSGEDKTTEAVKTNQWLLRISEEEGMGRQSTEILRAVKLCCETLPCWVHVVIHLGLNENKHQDRWGTQLRKATSDFPLGEVEGAGI